MKGLNDGDGEIMSLINTNKNISENRNTTVQLDSSDPLHNLVM